MSAREFSLISMTGYGRGSISGSRFRTTVELRSVNGRFLEIRAKLPRSLLFLEPDLRSILEKKIRRGVVDFTVTVHPVEPSLSVHLAEDVATAYVKQAERIAKDFDISTGLTALALLRLPGVAVTDDPAAGYGQEVGDGVKAALEQALENLMHMRQSEGEKLGHVLRRELAEVKSHKEWIRKHREQLNEKHFKRLEQRIENWVGKSRGVLEETRLYQEVAFYLDRADVTEELDRLAAHLKQCEEALDATAAKSLGKRLEFLAQEMGREVNTIGAKSDLVQITNHVVEMKLTLEKVREQVQNLE
ncbi:MAG: YicC/YloC family endoribonuclease [Bdellovibrionota bacterium]